MGRKITLILMTAAVFLVSVSSHFSVFAQDDIPALTSIRFSNAQVDGGFKSELREFTLTLEDNSVSPTLESYEIKGDAKIFVNYLYDSTQHPTGIEVKLEFTSGSVIYNFIYTNPAEYSTNSDNMLTSIYCQYGEISPAVNEEDTAYKLYIPSDLTQLVITPVTRDINAYCAPVELKLDNNQEPKITLICTASDGESKREYIVKTVRVEKTMQQVENEMMQPGYTSFVEGTRFYEKPEFVITAAAVIGGIIVLFILFKITRRIAVNPYDKDEKPFYSPVE